MLSIKRLIATLVLAAVASLCAPQAFAGDIQCGYTGPQESPGIAGDMQTPGITGEILTPGFTGDIGTPGLNGDMSCPGITGDISMPGLYALFATLLG